MSAAAGVWRHGAADRRRTAAAAAAHGQVQQTGAGGQVDVLDVFHLRAAHGTRLQRGTIHLQIYFKTKFN